MSTSNTAFYAWLACGMVIFTLIGMAILGTDPLSISIGDSFTASVNL